MFAGDGGDTFQGESRLSIKRRCAFATFLRLRLKYGNKEDTTQTGMCVSKFAELGPQRVALGIQARTRAQTPFVSATHIIYGSVIHKKKEINDVEEAIHDAFFTFGGICSALLQLFVPWPDFLGLGYPRPCSGDPDFFGPALPVWVLIAASFTVIVSPWPSPF